MVITLDKENEILVNSAIQEGYFETPTEAVNSLFLYLLAHNFSDSCEVDNCKKAIEKAFKTRNFELLKKSYEELSKLTGVCIIK